MQAQQIADLCVHESGARGYGQSNVLALIGLANLPDGEIDKKELRARMKRSYIQAGEERGFVFMMIVLPLLISIISNWIVKWIWDHQHQDRSEIRTGAQIRLCELSPRWMDTLTSTDTTPTKRTGQQP